MLLASLCGGSVQIKHLLLVFHVHETPAKVSNSLCLWALLRKNGLMGRGGVFSDRKFRLDGRCLIFGLARLAHAPFPSGCDLLFNMKGNLGHQLISSIFFVLRPLLAPPIAARPVCTES